MVTNMLLDDDELSDVRACCWLRRGDAISVEPVAVIVSEWGRSDEVEYRCEYSIFVSVILSLSLTFVTSFS